MSRFRIRGISPPRCSSTRQRLEPSDDAGMRSCLRVAAFCVLLGLMASPARGQVETRLSILQARGRGLTSAADVALVSRAVRRGDIETVRLALRVLGGAERPSQIPLLLTSLRH